MQVSLDSDTTIWSRSLEWSLKPRLKLSSAGNALVARLGSLLVSSLMEKMELPVDSNNHLLAVRVGADGHVL